MNRIGKVFNKPGHKAVIAYVTIGYPSVEATLEIVPALVENGCDIIELGIPFSDPLADGTTIQQASYHALKNGVTPRLCLEIARKLRQTIDTPLVFMGYYNPLLRYGVEPFCKDCAAAGVDGLIIPDLPPDEGSALEETTARQGLDLIYLLAPTSTGERIRLVAASSHGFIYLVSITGVTGARASLPAELESFINRVRALTKKPLCVGFGIATPEQAGRIARLADGVIIGSRIIQLIEADNTMKSLASFVRELRSAVDKVSSRD